VACSREAAAPSWLHLTWSTFSGLMDDAKCFAMVREHRWPEGVRCPACDSGAVVRDGCDDTQLHRQRCRCKACAGRFDDLTGLDAASRHLPPGDRCAMVLAGRHQPLWVWVLCLYFIGLNLYQRARLGAPPMAGETVRCMISTGGAWPPRFWWSRTPFSSLARGLLRTYEW